MMVDSGSTRRAKLAIIATHPIQYQAPLWRRLAQSSSLDVKVFYADRHGTTESFDPLYGKSFAWDVPLLDGYDYEFLSNFRIPGLSGPTANCYPKGLTRKLSAGKFDAVFIHGYMSGAAWAGYLAARRLGLPVFIRGDSHLVGRQLTGWRARIKMALLGLFLRNIAGCFAIGEWNRRYWKYYGVQDERIYTTLFSVDNARFRDTVAQGRREIESLRAGWGGDVDDTVFSFSGNLQRHKCVDILIGAFLKLCERRNDVHLVIIGEGPVASELRAISGDNDKIHWAGFVNQSTMPLYLAATNVFVLPSRMEAWGLVVNEAMACGLPCLVSDVVGAGPDMVSGPDCGLVFPAGDIDALLAAMSIACSRDVRSRWIDNLETVLAAASYDSNAAVMSAAIVSACRPGI